MKTTKFNWQCYHCHKRNIENIVFQFDIPQRYEAIWICNKCGKQNKIIFDFDVLFVSNNEKS